jgi:branched-subunit amino acid transport protein
MFPMFMFIMSHFSGKTAKTPVNALGTQFAPGIPSFAIFIPNTFKSHLSWAVSLEMAGLLAAVADALLAHLGRAVLGDMAELATCENLSSLSRK